MNALLRIAQVLFIGLCMALSAVSLTYIAAPKAYWHTWTWINYPECRDAPAVVSYHAGMTLCPGQAVRAVLSIPLPAAQPSVTPRN